MKKKGDKTKRNSKTKLSKKREIHSKKKKDLKKNLSKKKDKEILKKAKKTFESLKLKTPSQVAMDFAVKAYKKFGKSIKSIILFGSAERGEEVSGSDIDVILVIDDVSIEWDQELIAWYREELDKILKVNPYELPLHINTIRLSTWWDDLLRGDPVILNILRNGKTLIDMAGFFEPLKALLVKGKIKYSPESIYTTLQRAPLHLESSISDQMNSVSGLYWAMVDSAHSALMAAKVFPASPEHMPFALKKTFVDRGMLKSKFVDWYKDILVLYKEIIHHKKYNLRGIEIDKLQDRTNEFIKEMTKLVEIIIENK